MVYRCNDVVSFTLVDSDIAMVASPMFAWHHMAPWQATPEKPPPPPPPSPLSVPLPGQPATWPYG